MTFFGILFISAANDTTRAQINNIPEKSHVIPLLYNLMMFFAKCHVLARKFIEINNNIVANSSYIFQVNFAISSESKCMLCSKNIEKDYE